MKTTSKASKRKYTTAIAAAMTVAALLLPLAGTAREAEATFPGINGRIVFDSNLDTGEGVDNPEGDFEIFTVGVDGKGLTQLTKNGEGDLQPDWSPDGKKIAFVSRRTFAPGVYTMNSDGTKQKQVSRVPAVVFQSPSWSPDGERVAFVSDQDGPLNIYTMRADGKAQVRLTDNGVPTESGPVFSPNGKKIAFHTYRDGNFEVYKMRTDGTRPINVTHGPAGDFTPDWQPLQRRYERRGPTSRTKMGRDGVFRPSNQEEIESVRHE